MLALRRALMSAPRILLIDEPSVGLAPILVSRTIDKIRELKERFELTVLMAEQISTRPSASPIVAMSSCTARSPSRAAAPTSSTTTNLSGNSIWGCRRALAWWPRGDARNPFCLAVRVAKMRNQPRNFRKSLGKASFYRSLPPLARGFEEDPVAAMRQAVRIRGRT